MYLLLSFLTLLLHSVTLINASIGMYVSLWTHDDFEGNRPKTSLRSRRKLINMHAFSFMFKCQSQPVCWAKKTQGWVNADTGELLGRLRVGNGFPVLGKNCQCIGVLGGSDDMYLKCDWGTTLKQATAVPPYLCGKLHRDFCWNPFASVIQVLHDA